MEVCMLRSGTRQGGGGGLGRAFLFSTPTRHRTVTSSRSELMTTTA